MLISTGVDVLSNGRLQKSLSVFNRGGAIYLLKTGIFIFLSERSE